MNLVMHAPQFPSDGFAAARPFFCRLENMADDLRALYDELGRPSLAIFTRALRRRGIRATDEDLEFVKQQADRQLRAPPPTYRGRASH